MRFRMSSSNKKGDQIKEVNCMARAKESVETARDALTPSQMATLLSAMIPAKHNVLITGAPGTGKTDIVGQACERAKFQLVTTHPVVSDPTDFKGMPWPVNGTHAEFLPFGDLKLMMDADKPTVVFFDDLGQAPAAVQAAAMQLLLSRRINGHAVSKHVTFLAATNRKMDRAGVSGILEPVKSRFWTIVELKVDVDDWCTWGFRNDIETDVIAFVRARPNLLHDFKATSDLTNSPCPRTWKFLSDMMKLKLPKDVEYKAYAGAVGQGAAGELSAFLKIKRTLVPADMIIMNPDSCDVPTEPDALYATTVGLAHKTTEATIGRVMKYVKRMPKEFGVLLVRDALRKFEEKEQRALIQTRPMIEWQIANKDVML